MLKCYWAHGVFSPRQRLIIKWLNYHKSLLSLDDKCFIINTYMSGKNLNFKQEIKLEEIYLKIRCPLDDTSWRQTAIKYSGSSSSEGVKIHINGDTKEL